MTTAKSVSAGYRADIDGLRAVAVLSIVLAHLGVQKFRGGYVGVDIFFVISGFLITGILVRSMASGRYSILDFYARRIVRIFPALFVMLLTVSVLALFILLPGELVRFARSLAATSLFGSNVVFYTEAGYFDAASDVKPLLHTWSLGIEEQFYVLWPLLLSLVGIARRTRAALILSVVALMSLLAATVMVRHAPSAAFYLLPFRAWELAAGGLLVFVRPVHVRWINQVMASIGLTLIGYAVLRFASATPFPGLNALFPVVGAGLIIFAGPETLVAKGLALGPATWIGRISYSLYLWHWPIIVFAEIGLLLTPSPGLMIGELVLSITLAYASLRLVEIPFRERRDLWPTSTILVCGVAAIVVTAASASVVILAKGFPQRFTPAEQMLAAYTDRDYEARFQRGICFAVDPGSAVNPSCLVSSGKRPSVLLIGDSMAAHLWPGLSFYSGEYDIMQATMTGCRPGVYPKARMPCERYFRSVLTDWAPSQRPDLVILAGRWQWMDVRSFETTVQVLHDLGIPIIVVGPPPIYTTQLPRLLVMASRNHDQNLITRHVEPESFEVDGVLRAIAGRRGIPYVSLTGNLCEARRCRTLAKPGTPMQFDYGHFSPEGSTEVAMWIMPQVRQALTSSPPLK